MISWIFPIFRVIPLAHEMLGTEVLLFLKIIKLLLLFNFQGRVVPTDLEANQVQDTLCLQLTGKFRGCVERVSKIEIEAVDKQGKLMTVAATTEPSSDRDGSFKTTTHPLQMWSTYQLRAVAIYRDAEGGGPGEFRAHSEEITVTVQGLNQI